MISTPPNKGIFKEYEEACFFRRLQFFSADGRAPLQAPVFPNAVDVAALCRLADSDTHTVGLEFLFKPGLLLYSVLGRIQVYIHLSVSDGLKADTVVKRIVKR